MKFFGLLLAFVVFCSGYDFSYCGKYYKISSVKVSKKSAVYIEKIQIGDDKNANSEIFLFFSKKRPNPELILKEDPFVGLYLLKGLKKPKRAYTLKPIDDRAMKMNFASVGDGHYEKGIILERQKGFMEYAKFSASTPEDSAISNICYQMYGIGVGENKFIQKKYIDRFLKQKEAYYGDIGVRLYTPKDENDKSVKVEFVDPFFPKVPFVEGDEIVAIDGRKIEDYYDFEWVVSNLEEKKVVRVEINRGEENLFYDVNVGRRYGGWFLNDTFFERFDINLSDDMKISHNDNINIKGISSLQNDDVLLWINDVAISNYNTKTREEKINNLKKLLTKGVKEGKLDTLILRNNFQFRLNLLERVDNEYIRARIKRN